MTNVMDKYAEFISKQLVREGKINLVEKEDPKISSKVAKDVGISPKEADYAVSHVASHGNLHTYAVGEGDGAHATHDTSTGKTHQFSLPQKRVSVKSVHEIMNKAIPGGVSKEHAKDVHADHPFNDMWFI